MGMSKRTKEEISADFKFAVSKLIDTARYAQSAEREFTTAKNKVADLGREMVEYRDE